jgi:hypothetical protein
MVMRLGHKRKFMLALALAGASAAAAAQEEAAPPDAPPPDVQKILQNCDAHKFETVVVTTKDGEVHNSNVKLCGAQGQSDEAWLRTLKDAADKTAASAELPPEVKQQIVTALNSEIARLTALLPPPPRAALPGLPSPGRAAPTDNVASGYSVLPPLPDRPSSPPTVVAPTATARASTAVVAMAPPPRPIGISLRCTSARDFPSAEPCDTVDRETQLLIRADEAVAVPVTLRFVRRGEGRGEVRLAPMGRGQAARISVPAEVCRGILRSKLEIQVVGPAAQSFGPFELRC